MIVILQLLARFRLLVVVCQSSQQSSHAKAERARQVALQTRQRVTSTDAIFLFLVRLGRCIAACRYDDNIEHANPGPSKNELAVMATRKLRETDWHTRPGWPAASQPSADVGTWHNTYQTRVLG